MPSWAGVTTTIRCPLVCAFGSQLSSVAAADPFTSCSWSPSGSMSLARAGISSLVDGLAATSSATATGA